MPSIGFVRDGGDGELLVGAEDKSRNYCGPVARVYVRDGFLWIVTDDHEGVAMINEEALPSLQEALRQLAKSTEKV